MITLMHICFGTETRNNDVKSCIISVFAHSNTLCRRPGCQTPLSLDLDSLLWTYVIANRCGILRRRKTFFFLFILWIVIRIKIYGCVSFDTRSVQGSCGKIFLSRDKGSKTNFQQLKKFWSMEQCVLFRTQVKWNRRRK